MSKGLRAFFIFWIVWDIGFFVKNLIQGHLVFMIVFAVLACIQTGSYIMTNHYAKKREVLEAQIAADRAAWRKRNDF